VIFYADNITESIKRTVATVTYRREKQIRLQSRLRDHTAGVKRAAQASLHMYDGSGERDTEAVVEESADDVRR